MESLKPIYSFMVGGFQIDITPDMVVQWVIIALVALLAWWATKDLKLKPNKKQTAVEGIYTMINDLVSENAGTEFSNITPFIGCMGIFILIMNLTGLIGIVPPTKNYSVAVGMAIITFFMVQGYAIKKRGGKEYLHGYLHPYWPMLPLNILERVMLPVSLSLRLFGNILAATFIIELVYENLAKIGFIAQIGLPVFFQGYFDLFDGLVQAVIFIMLTMINIKIVSEH